MNTIVVPNFILKCDRKSCRDLSIIYLQSSALSTFVTLIGGNNGMV